MVQSLILETTFLIDLERESLRKSRGSAQDFLRAHSDDRLCVSFVTVGEMAAGVETGRRDVWEDFFRPFRVLPSSLDVASEYGRAYRHLAANAQLIGGNDLWIAATALASGMPLVTRNLEHFRRIPSLNVVSY